MVGPILPIANCDIRQLQARAMEQYKKVGWTIKPENGVYKAYIRFVFGFDLFSNEKH